MPLTARASEEGKRNTALALGATAAALLLTQRNKVPGAIVAGAAVVAASQLGTKGNHHSDRDYRRDHDYQYDNHDYRYDHHDYGYDNRDYHSDYHDYSYDNYDRDRNRDHYQDDHHDCHNNNYRDGRTARR